MTAPKFMNVVRFKLKPECVDQYFEVHRQNTSWNRLKVVNDKSNAIKKPLYKGLVTLAK